MNRCPTIITLAAMAALSSAGHASACGEGVFHMGEGLQFQGYLAPHRATIVVVEAQGRPPEERLRVYRGLAQAGHRLMVARNGEELAQALAGHRVDVIIAAAGALDEVVERLPEADGGPRLLHVAARGGGDPSPLQARGQSIAEGASLSQYLRAIQRLVRG